MNKDDILAEVKTITNKNIILEISTGGGKSLCAMYHMEQELKSSNPDGKILIVIPKLTLIKNWIDEFVKWNKEDILKHVEFSTYISLPKNYDKDWIMICFDEAHHITERCFRSIDISHNRYKARHLFLSATLSIPFKMILKRTFPDVYVYKLPLKTAIDNGILPEPVILLYPLRLDTSKQEYIYVKKAAGIKTVVRYENRWPVIKNSKLSPHILCTQQQYYSMIEEDIQYFKKYPKLKSVLDRRYVLRLKMLSEFKTNKVLNILSMLKDYRTITFCSSIDQTELLGKNCVHSKNPNRMEILDNFNKKKIKHITSCDILSEGVNVTDCRIGIFARINASDTQIKQKLGRLLRHQKPVIVIPYYVNTREEEIVHDLILTNFNDDKIFTITGINEILKYLK